MNFCFLHFSHVTFNNVFYTICYVRTDEVKWGKLVGEDKDGNKYYHNNLYFLGEYRYNNDNVQSVAVSAVTM